MTQAGDGLVSLMGELAGRPLRPAAARQLAEDFHNQLHGALCKAISGRVPEKSQAALRRHISVGVCRVLRAQLAHGLKG